MTEQKKPAVKRKTKAPKVEVVKETVQPKRDPSGMYSGVKSQEGK